MTRIDQPSNKSNVAAARDRKANADALASVRAELLAIPRDDVAAPADNPFVFARDALVFAQAAVPAASTEEAALLGQVELLARALEQAQLEWTWQPPKKVVADCDAVVAKAERAFAEIEELFDLQVRRGVIWRRQIPRRKGTSLQDRGRRVTQLIEILRDHDLYTARAILDLAGQLAVLVLDLEPALPSASSPTDLRNRAYTALVRALAQHSAMEREHSIEDSGVFAIRDNEISPVHASR